MHDLIAITPLGGSAPRVDSFDGLRIVENPDSALASLAARLGQEKRLATAARKFLGVALPGVGKLAGKGALSAFWIGPDQWMIEAPMASYEDLAAQVKAAVGDAGSVVEQTDGWARFDLDGARACDVFELLCPLDTLSMEAGSVSRTSIEHLGCFVLRRAVGFSVLGPRSSARSLHHALCAAANSAI